MKIGFHQVNNIQQVDIKPITAEDTLDLRHRVMWPDRPKDHVMVRGDHSALHFGAFVDNQLVGVASFFPDGQRFQLRKLAVDPTFQGQGIASQILITAIPVLRETGAVQVWCDARVTAIGFYQKIGFQADSETFEKHGLSYVKARKSIA